MRIAILCLAVVVTIGCGEAEAGPSAVGGEHTSPAEMVPPEIKNAVLAWSKCRAAKVLELVDSPLGNEAVVDEALTQCLEYERSTTELWEKHYGANSGGQVQRLRARWREGLIADVDRLRGGATKPTDPTKIWGICVGENLPNPLPTDVAADTLVSAAMATCVPAMERVREDYAQRYGAAKAAAMVEEMRTEIHKFAIASIEETRSAR